MKIQKHEWQSLYHTFIPYRYRIMDTMRSIMKLPLFIQLLGFLWIVAFALFSLDQESESDFVKLVSTSNIIWQFVVWYSFCQLSENVTRYSDEVSGVLYNLDWLSMSPNKRMALKLMLARSQRQFRFSCLDIFDCSLDTFLKVILKIRRKKQVNLFYQCIFFDEFSRRSIKRFRFTFSCITHSFKLAL